MGTPLRQQAAYLLKSMKVIAAYMLAVVGGNAKPSAADVKKILSAVAIDLDDDAENRLNTLVEEMSTKDVNEVIEAGLEKLKTVPGGGAGGAAAPAAGGAAASGGAAAAEEAKPESESEDDDDGAVGGMFGDDYQTVCP